VPPERVPLQFAGPVAVGEPTGACERAVLGTGLTDALDLLDRLIDAPGFVAASLTSPDRDRLLVAVHQRCFGDRIDATVGCVACHEPFQLDFHLQDLLEGLVDGQDVPAGARRADLGGAVLDVPQLGRVRVPTGADQLALRDLPLDEARRELAARCLLDAVEPAADVGEADLDALETALEERAPIVDLDLVASCPACGSSQPVHFDIQTYLLRSILADRPQLLADLHCLAAAYRWSPADILALTRSERLSLVRLVERDEARRLRVGMR
jgi:hypothetical protein